MGRDPQWGLSARELPPAAMVMACNSSVAVHRIARCRVEFAPAGDHRGDIALRERISLDFSLGRGGRMSVEWVVVGLDNGGTTNNGTILDSEGRFLLDQMAEVPSNVREGPDKAIQSLVDSVDQVLGLTGVPLAAVRAIGLDTPGPASADGVISSKGATNFGDAGWGGFDIRGALAERIGLPVIYNNDGNAAALYAHHVRFGVESARHSSLSAIVGTGLGGGLVE